MASILCFGEVLLRLSPPGRDLLLQRPQLEVRAGGAEANVAAALACDFGLAGEAAVLAAMEGGGFHVRR